MNSCSLAAPLEVLLLIPGLTTLRIKSPLRTLKLSTSPCQTVVSSLITQIKPLETMTIPLEWELSIT